MRLLLSSGKPLKNQNKLAATATVLAEAMARAVPETGSENRAQCRKFAVAACGVCRKYIHTHTLSQKLSKEQNQDSMLWFLA